MRILGFLKCLLFGPRDNAHKYARPLFCGLGAHDWIPMTIHSQDSKHIEATMICLYCERAHREQVNFPDRAPTSDEGAQQREVEVEYVRLEQSAFGIRILDNATGRIRDYGICSLALALDVAAKNNWTVVNPEG